MRILNRWLLEDNIRRAAEEDLDNNKVFGSAYWVFQEGETVCQRCFGITSLTEPTPVTDTTLFRLASMTKPVMAVGALILEEQGALSLADPITNYLPEWKNVHIKHPDGEGGYIDCGPAQRSITLRDLLTHTSGIGSEPIKAQRMPPEAKATVDATLAYYRQVGLDFEPGTAQAYSGFAAFDALGKVIETVTGLSLTEFLTRELFTPCGMTDTVFIPSPEQQSRLITMHDREDGRNVHGYTVPGCLFENFPWTHPVGGAGLASTLRDYAAFARMLLQEGQGDNGRVLSPAAVARMRTPYVTPAMMPGNEQWGLGVRVITSPAYGDLAVGTFGWSGAYGSHFWVEPENRVAAVFLKNSRVDGGSGNQSARRFEEAVKAAFQPD